VLAIVAFAGCALAVVLLQGVHLGAPEEQPVETHVISPFCFNRAATSALTTAVVGDAGRRREEAVATAASSSD